MLMDYYKVLGLDQGASEKEVKLAYRKLASTHHPDKGGDTKKFQEIQAAYDAITTGKAVNPNNMNSPGFHDLHDMFEQVHRGGAKNWSFNRRGWQEDVANPDINISINCTLEEAHTGFTKIVKFNLPEGTAKEISVTFPPGCGKDVKLRHAGEGGQLLPQKPPGDLYVKLNIQQHNIWEVDRSNLHSIIKISAWQAMFGSTVELKDINGTLMEVTIPAGTQYDSQLRLRGKGLNIRGTTGRGDVYLTVKITIPKLDQDDRTKTIIDIENKIKNA